MKKQKTKELNDKDLLKELNNKREELRQLRFDVAGTKAKDVKLASKIKKTIAKVLTEMRGRSKGTQA